MAFLLYMPPLIVTEWSHLNLPIEYRYIRKTDTNCSGGIFAPTTIYAVTTALADSR